MQKKKTRSFPCDALGVLYGVHKRRKKQAHNTSATHYEVLHSSSTAGAAVEQHDYDDNSQEIPAVSRL